MSTDNAMESRHHSWQPEISLPDGHRLFPSNTEFRLSNGKPLIALADDSGRFPQDTDDGVLWLDFDTPMHLGKEVFLIPLLTPDGDKTRTSSNAPTLVVLSSMYEWALNVYGILFDARRR